MKILIDIPEEEYQKTQDGRVAVTTMRKAILQGTPIPDNATNGDVIKVMFPFYDFEIYEHKGYVMVFYEDFYTTYPLRWWNAPYKKGGKECG